LFKRADRWFSRFVRLATALHEGFWLGCLSPDDLNAITASQPARVRRRDQHQVQNGLIPISSLPPEGVFTGVDLRLK